MAQTKVMRTTQECRVRSDAGLHGKVLDGARILAYQTLVVDLDTLHDGWIRVVAPNPPINDDGTYLRYGLPCFIEYAHLEDVNRDVTVIKLEINWQDKSIRIL